MGGRKDDEWQGKGCDAFFILWGIGGRGEERGKQPCMSIHFCAPRFVLLGGTEVTKIFNLLDYLASPLRNDITLT